MLLKAVRKDRVDFFPDFALPRRAEIASQCFIPSVARSWHGGVLLSESRTCGQTSPRQIVRMAKSGKKKPGQKAKRASAPETAVPASSAAPDAGLEAADREALRQDVAAFKARNQAEEDAMPLVSDAYGLAKKVFDNLLLADFFLVIGLLGWLIVALVPHFAAKNESLLDPWLALWQPFIQPVLGVLMLATIGQGMLTYMFNTDD